MSATALVCPHCGARQADREWTTPKDEDASAPLHVSSEEAAAILQMRGAGALDLEEPAGPMSLVLPRPEADGATRLAEWALTALAAPILVPGFVIALLRLRFVAQMIPRFSESSITLIVGTFGVATAMSICEIAGWSLGATLGLVGLSAGALVARWVIRRGR